MAKVCAECGKELSFRDSYVLDGRALCGACLEELDARERSTTDKKTRRAVPTGSGVADGFRFFAGLSILGGVVMAMLNAEIGYLALVFAVGGVFYALLLFGFAAVIDLLRIIAGSVVSED